MKKFLSILIALSIMNISALKDVKADTPENVLAGENVVKELEEKESELTFAEKLSEKLTAVEEFVKDHSNTILLSAAGVTGVAGLSFTGYNVTTGFDKLKELWAKGNALSLKEKVKETMRIIFCGVTKSSGDLKNIDESQSEELIRAKYNINNTSDVVKQAQNDVKDTAEYHENAEEKNITQLEENYKNCTTQSETTDNDSSSQNLKNNESKKKN